MCYFLKKLVVAWIIVAGCIITAAGQLISFGEGVFNNAQAVPQRSYSFSGPKNSATVFFNKTAPRKSIIQLYYQDVKPFRYKNYIVRWMDIPRSSDTASLSDFTATQKGYNYGSVKDFRVFALSGGTLDSVLINDVSDKRGNLTEGKSDSAETDYSVFLLHCKIEHLSLRFAQHFARTYELHCQQLSASYIRIQGGNVREFELELDSLPKSIFLDFGIDSGIADLSHIHNVGRQKNEECDLILGSKMDIANTKFDYQYFRLVDTASLTTNDISDEVRLLQEIKKMQTRYGFINGFEKADIRLRQLGYLNRGLWGRVLNFLDNWWWGYGYDKELIFKNSCIIMLIAFFLNLLCFRRLLFETYTLDEFRAFYSRKILNKTGGQGYYVLYCFLYTMFIFWTLRLSFEKLKLDNLYLTFLIMFEYLAGIICLAYIAGYVVSR